MSFNEFRGYSAQGVDGLVFSLPKSEIISAQIQYEGFRSIRHAEAVSEMVHGIGLSTENIQTLRYVGNENYFQTKRNWQVSGHYNFGTGEYAVYKPFEGLPAIAQFGTLVHELGYANSALRVENNDLYGGERNRERAATHAREVTNQSIATGVFLNNYHEMLAVAWFNDEISFGHLVEETHAIMLELRATNPQQLKDKEAKQAKRVEGEVVKIYEGATRTFIDLLQANENTDVVDAASLDDHFVLVKSTFFQDSLYASYWPRKVA